MPSLFVIQGPDQGRRFELPVAEVGIGRDATNTISLRDTEVSRHHGKLRPSEDGFEWVDLGSSNGTFINSVRINEHRLRSGDRIQLGRTLMIFTGASANDEPSAVANMDVGITGDVDGSRIIRSVSQEEGSQFLVGFESSTSPWLARVRGNLQVMYRTALAVSHTLDIDQLLKRIMELIFEWVEADRGCIMLLDRETDELLPKAYLDRKQPSTGEKLRISQTILDYVRTNQEGVLTSDARDDERWDAGASIVKLGVREAICVPMQGRYGIVGVIYIDTFTSPTQLLQMKQQVNKFSEEHLKLMVAIGHQAALAVEDTSYYSAMLQAERLAAIGQTIAGLSHHIKNILQGIRGGSYLIEEGLKVNDPEVTTKGWRIVERNQERISTLVMDMLTFSKERQPEMVPSDLNQVVGDVLELMRVRAEESGVGLVDARDPNIPTKTFDPEGLHRAILNILANAIDACLEVESGEVKVSTHWDQDQNLLEVRIRDNGPGIPSDQQKKIFNAFESGKGNRGTGLGLPVSKKILEEHDGTILLSSEEGKGAEFILQFPAIDGESLTMEIPPDL